MQTNDLGPPETEAVFLFCNILTVGTSLWGCGPSDSQRRSLRSPGLARCAPRAQAGSEFPLRWKFGVGTLYQEVVLRGTRGASGGSPVRRSGCWSLDSSSRSWRVCNRMARTTCSEVALKCRAISVTCHPQFSMVAQLSSNVSSESMPFVDQWFRETRRYRSRNSAENSENVSGDSCSTF
jgi:hypothetical protein